MASPTSNRFQAMTSEAMKHTVLTGPAILVQSASNFVVKMIEFENSISIVKKLDQCLLTAEPNESVCYFSAQLVSYFARILLADLKLAEQDPPMRN